MTSNVKALADSVLGEDALPGLKKGAFPLCVHVAFLGSFIFRGGEVSLSAGHWIQAGGFSVVGTTM